LSIINRVSLQKICKNFK